MTRGNGQGKGAWSPILLLVEDDPDDVILVEETFADEAPHVRIQVVSDGEQALAYLKGEGKYADRATYPMPELVLLDVNMPRRTGLEVLAWMRGAADTRDLPVLMLSSSRERRDVDKAYDLGANGYIPKRADVQGLVDMVRGVAAYLTLAAQEPTAPLAHGERRIPPGQR